MAYPKKKEKAVRKIVSLMDRYEVSAQDIIDCYRREIERRK